MRFSLFVHMERIDAAEAHAKLYKEFLELCRIADEGGMCSIWTGEHHCMDFTIAPNPFLSLVDLARRTKNVRLGTGTVIAPFWHPIKLAGEAAMTDILTDGRLEIGIARGAYSYEYERLRPGMDAWEAGQRMREVVPTLKKLWAGNYAHDGEFFQFPASSSAPKPLQAGGPPLWIAARDPNSHEFAVREGCHVQVTPLWQGDEEIESLMQRFKAACDLVKPAKQPKIMLLQHGYVGEGETDLEEATRLLHRFYCYFGAWFKNDRAVSQGLLDPPLSQDELDSNPMFTRPAIRENLMIGLPDQVIDRLKRFEALGYDEYSLWIDSGMPFEMKKASLERFITEVMPSFA